MTEQMIPRVFHHIWVGEAAIPDSHAPLRDGWISRHPGWEFRLWRDADLRWLRNQSLFDRAPSAAQKADIARFEILHRYGGVYLDVDMECLRAIDSLLDGLTFFAGRESEDAVGIAIFGATRGHKLLEEVIARIPMSCLTHQGAPIASQTGPDLLTRVTVEGKWESKAGVRIFPPPFFYPYTWDEPWLRDSAFPTAFAVRHWSHSWRSERGVTPRLAEVRGAGLVDPAWRRAVRGEASGWIHKQSNLRLRAPTRRALRRIIRRLRGPQPSSPIQAVSFGARSVLVGTPLGTRLLCPVEDLSLTPELATEGVYDPSFVDFLQQHLRAGMTFVDVGANVGLFTVIAGQLVGRGGRVVAYECNPSALEYLRKNVALNWFDDRTVIVPKAAHRDDAPRDLFAAKDMQALSSLVLPVEGRTTLSESDRVLVECERLDKGLSEIPHIDLLKIDVEGGEADVLDGAIGLFDQGRVSMLSIEYRLDAMNEAVRPRMERHLLDLESRYGAIFHAPRITRRLPIDEVLATANYPQLLIRLAPREFYG